MNFKCFRYLSLFLALIMLFSVSSITTLAADSSFRSSIDFSFVDKYFAEEYTIWGIDGSNMTELFYREMTPYYEAGDLQTIATYLAEHVDFAECFSVTLLTPPTGARGYAEYSAIWKFADVLPSTLISLTGRPANYNEVEVHANFWFAYDDEECIIFSATPTYISYINLIHQYSVLDPVYTFPNNTYEIAANERSITYTFTIDIIAPVDAAEVAFGWHYNREYSRTFNCP